MLGKDQREGDRERKGDTEGSGGAGQGWPVTPKEPRGRGWITRT